MLLFTFCIAQKVTMLRLPSPLPRSPAQQPASDPKNSLNERSVDLVSCCAVSPVPFSLTPLFVFMAKKRPSVLLKQFWVTVFYRFEMIF